MRCSHDDFHLLWVPHRTVVFCYASPANCRISFWVRFVAIEEPCTASCLFGVPINPLVCDLEREVRLWVVIARRSVEPVQWRRVEVSDKCFIWRKISRQILWLSGNVSLNNLSHRNHFIPFCQLCFSIIWFDHRLCRPSAFKPCRLDIVLISCYQPVFSPPWKSWLKPCNSFSCFSYCINFILVTIGSTFDFQYLFIG